MGARNLELTRMAEVVMKAWHDGQSAKAIAGSTGYPLMSVRKIIGEQFGNSEERKARASAEQGSSQLLNAIVRHFASQPQN